MSRHNHFIFDGNLVAAEYFDGEKISSLLAKMQESHSSDSINQLLEFYNLANYLEVSGKENKEKIKKLNADISKRFCAIVAKEPIDDLEEYYQPGFVELLITTKTLKSAFQRKLLNKIYVYNLLKQKAIVVKYPDYIIERINENPLNFEYIISKLIKNDDVYIPEGDYSSLCASFIRHPHIHPDYLQLIWQGIDGMNRYVKDYNEKLKLLAKSIYDETTNTIINNQGVRQSVSFLVTTSHQQFKDEVSNTIAGKGRCYPAFVDAEWLHQNREKESALNYLLFDENIFTRDTMFRAVNNKHEDGLTDFFGVKAKDGKEYRGNTLFEFNFRICTMVVQVIDSTLLSDGNDITGLIEYYLNTYIKSAYKIQFPKYPKVKKKLDIQYKIVALCGLIEHILKCWKAFCDTRDKIIKPEYINLISEVLREKPAGLIDEKYATLTADGERIARTLMSNQSETNCFYYKEHKKCLLDLLMSGIKIDDSNEHINVELKPLCLAGILDHKERNWILKDENKAAALARLWRQPCINLRHYEDNAIKDLIESKYMVAYTGLLSDEEFDLLQYVLINRYRDGLGIRNKYAHGLPIYQDANRYKNDYYIALTMLVMLIIKIDDELNYFINSKTGKMNYISFAQN